MKNKKAIIITVIVAALLAITLLFAYNFPQNGGENSAENESAQLPVTSNAGKAEKKTESEKPSSDKLSKDIEKKEQAPSGAEKDSSAQKPEASAEPDKTSGESLVPEAKTDAAFKNSGGEKEGREEKGEPSALPDESGSLTCTLSVRCDTLLRNMDSLDSEKRELVPENGVIFPETTVVFYEGESVFNLLKREMKQNKIHMEFRNTPIYKSAYIEGIGNIYEFDCGELSGWMYKVNGVFPNYGCSSYTLKKGDKVEWLYTCDLGADVGNAFKSQLGEENE